MVFAQNPQGTCFSQKKKIGWAFKYILVLSCGFLMSLYHRRTWVVTSFNQATFVCHLMKWYFHQEVGYFILQLFQYSYDLIESDYTHKMYMMALKNRSG